MEKGGEEKEEEEELFKNMDEENKGKKNINRRQPLKNKMKETEVDAKEEEVKEKVFKRS